ncbi:unnamed protein product [Clavelina lepadiformis]|uniref:Uncharacterized protein n=1 Tax=Clavelina lepadiformis TaxID=159417 RepID=A0ABP0G2F4_CLALP
MLIRKFGLFSRRLFVYSGSDAFSVRNHPNEKRNLSSFKNPFKSSNSGLDKVISDAERIVGFPTSFLSLRTLLSDELSGVAMHIRKLVKSNHPLLSIARGVLFDSKDSVQGRGIVVLLLSKAIVENASGIDHIQANEAFNKQRALAELTELIHIAFLVHRGIVNKNTIDESSNGSSSDKYWSEMELGNKMAVLSGDFLLANACAALADLKNLQVVNLMSKAISDMSHGFFILPESGKFSAMASLDDLPDSTEKWEDVMCLAYGSLLSNACRSVTEFVDMGDKYGDVCSNFGKHFTLAHQASFDFQRISKLDHSNNGKINLAPSELCALPVVIAAHDNGGRKWFEQFLKKSEKDGRLILMTEELTSHVRESSSIMEKCRDVGSKHRMLALDCLKELPESEARDSLEKLTCAFSDVG